MWKGINARPRRRTYGQYRENVGHEANEKCSNGQYLQQIVKIT
jgi:hypothetical protein